MRKVWIAVFEFWISIGFTNLAHAEIPLQDFEFFLEKSYGRFWDEGEEANLEDEFYQFAEREGSPNAAVEAFALERDLTIEEAEAFALAIIDSAKYREVCNNGHDPVGCAFTPDTRVYQHLVTTGFSDESGEIAFVIGKELPTYWQPSIESAASFIRIIADHPAQEAIFRKLAVYSGTDIWVTALLMASPLNFDNAVYALGQVSYSSMHERTYWSGSMMAVLESVYKTSRRAKSPLAQIVNAQSLMALQFKAGLHQRALQTWRYLLYTHRKNFFYLGNRVKDPKWRYRYISAVYELGNDLAATFLIAGKFEAAQVIIGVLNSIQNSGAIEQSEYLISVTRAIEDTINPQYSGNDLYDMYIHGRLEGQPEIKPKDKSGPAERSGWLFSVAIASPIVKTLIARHLYEGGLRKMSDYLLDRRSYQRVDRGADPVMAIADIMPDDFSRRKETWSRRISEVWQDWENAKEVRRSRLYQSLVVSTPIPVAFEEISLPEKLQPAVCHEHQPARIKMPAGVDLPVKPSQVVRYEERNGRKAIVFLSADLDNPGEIPAFGYWFQRNTLDGTKWEPALYLGIQQHFPYFIRPSSKLPLTGVDGKIDIEVEIREIDPSSIFFPPVGLSLKRDECNLYLSFDLKTLRRDTDSDGLTDIVEARMGLNPASSDTDGDGIGDGLDSLPLTPFDPKALDVDKELAINILTKFTHFERNVIVLGSTSADDKSFPLKPITRAPQNDVDPKTIFLVSNPDIFRGIRLPARLIVYSPGDVEKLNRGPAPFYPLEVTEIFSRPDQSEKYVIWSASWIGGQFFVRCKDGKCETVVVSSWIT